MIMVKLVSTRRYKTLSQRFIHLTQGQRIMTGVRDRMGPILNHTNYSEVCRHRDRICYVTFCEFSYKNSSLWVLHGERYLYWNARLVGTHPTRHLEIQRFSHSPRLYIAFICLNQGWGILYYGHQGVRGVRTCNSHVPDVKTIVLSHTVHSHSVKWWNQDKTMLVIFTAG